MMRLGSYMLLIFACLSLFSCSVRPGPDDHDLALNDLEKNFRDPGPEWRGKPFWSWNGNLEKGELIRQIHVFKQMGMGGFFMHSRVGLQTEYLGDKWFDLINSCADTAEKLGMEAWLYDEDRWPSGTAGGMVTRNKNFRMQFLTGQYVPAENFAWNDSVLAVFQCDVNGLNFTGSRRLSKDNDMKSLHGNLLVFVRTYDRPNDFYNGYTYANTMSREATAEYIRLTHEKYREKCGDRLGGSIRGIFTDEPHRGGVFDHPGSWNVPWTSDFPERFREKFGYDILDRLPELYLHKDGEVISQVKWHYMDLAQELFLENWEKPYADWCRKNNMIFTGHVLHEDNLMSQSIMEGSLMRFYENMDYPGVDVLTEGNNNYWIVKQVASVARQMNQKFILSELYGCSGWQMTFENYKAAGNWQALFGVNLRCPHLSWYAMQGEAKRDYPASISFQSGWYPEFGYVESYFSRLGLMLSQGKPECDMLVITPIESTSAQASVGWANSLSGNTREIQEVEKNYRDLFSWLQNAHIDFDYGDEEMMGRMSRLGRTEDGQPVLYVGHAPYKVVLVGNMVTIRKSTVELLGRFIEAGGRVVFAGQAPGYVDAVRSDETSKLAARGISIPYTQNAIIGTALDFIAPTVEITDLVSGEKPDSIYVQVRRDSFRKYVVLMNMNRDTGYAKICVRIPGEGLVTEWDCTSGEPYRINATGTEGYREIMTTLPPAGEHVYTLSSERPDNLEEKPIYAPDERISIAGPFRYSLNENNVCVLDMGSFAVGQEPFSRPTEILKIDRALRDRYGLKYRGGDMLQPWFASKFRGVPETKGKVRISFPFIIENMPRDTVYLCMETPELFSVQVNGNPVSYQNGGWWIDPCIKRIPLSVKTLKPGRNTVLLTADFSDNTNLEALYLIGNFGVRLNGSGPVITWLPDKLDVGDIVSQGLPFYSGTVTYHIPVEKAWKEKPNLLLHTPEFEAACIKVSGKGAQSRMIAWQPYHTEVSDIIDKGDEIMLDVVLTRRNTFGPLHQLPARAWAYGPFSYTSEGDAFSPGYVLLPSGLLGNMYLEACRIGQPL